MSDEDQTWRNHSFRQSVINKLNDELQSNNVTTMKNTVDMENHVFSKARNKNEYLGYVARLILHFRDMSKGNKPDGTGSQQQEKDLALKLQDLNLDDLQNK